MSSLIPALVLIVAALLGARVSFSTERAPAGPRLLLRTGTHFLLVGFLIGPAGIGLLTPESTRSLFPFLALGIGWVGFHFGLQLDRENLRLFPFSHFALAIGQAILTWLLFAAAAIATVWLVGLDDPLVPLLVVGAACTAAITAPGGIAMVASSFRVKGRVRDLLFFIGSIDAMVGIVALQLMYSFFRPTDVPGGVDGLAGLGWVGAALGLGVVCGIVFLWLSRSRSTSEELALYVLGICAFAAGAALHWGLSPLFVSATMGAVVANLARDVRRVLALLERWEKMVYVTFLLLAGALLQLPTWLVVPAAVAYALIRFVAKVAATSAMVTVIPFPSAVPKALGLGLIPQGGISIAMAASAVLVYGDLQVGGFDAEAALFSVIVIGIVLSELAGPFLTLGVLVRAGEVSREVVEAGERRRRRRLSREAIAGGSGGQDAGPGEG